VSGIKKFFGPSTLVAAAFIGPGTVTMCTLAGNKYGYELLWALLFSTLATLILQEMAARIGLVTQDGLGTIVKTERSKGFLGVVLFILVLGAVLIGNAAYEAGNIGGAILGADLILSGFDYWALVIGLVSFLLLFFGKYKNIEGFLIGLVLLISFAFLITVFLVGPSLSEIFAGFIPSFDSEVDWLIVIALVGTTVVPYNLFLQASLVSKKYSSVSQLRDLRIENAVAIILGGLVSMLIVIVAASTHGELVEVKNASDMAVQLEPLLGAGAKYGIGIGLLAAGLSSAITAPLAAALAARELFGWSRDDKDWRFRATWMVVLGIGIFVSLFGFKPIPVIKFAQVMNGLLLPIIAVYLLYLVNQRRILKEFTNTLLLNLLGGFIVLITIVISTRTFLLLFS
jgi:Mn2+/Fe2+ NRAMP family transporter